MQVPASTRQLTLASTKLAEQGLSIALQAQCLLLICNASSISVFASVTVLNVVKPY